MRKEPGNKVRIGIIGIGKMGELHLAKYLQLENVEVVGLYDTDKIRSKFIAEKYGLTEFGDLTSLFFEVDAVSIASHTDSHFLVCKAALESGTHVLIEKPMCGRSEQARELVRLAEKNRLILQVGYLERFRLNRLANRLGNPRVKFIDVHWLATELPREPSVDVIDDLLVHPLDMVLSLIQDEVKTVSVIGSRMLTPLLDMVSVRIDFIGGAAANLWISRVSSHRERRLYLFSDKEQASINFITNHIEILRPIAGIIEKNSFSLESENSKPDVLLEQCKSFIECVQLGNKPLISGEHGLRVLELAEAIRNHIPTNVRHTFDNRSLLEMDHGL